VETALPHVSSFTPPLAYSARYATEIKYKAWSSNWDRGRGNKPFDATSTFAGTELVEKHKQKIRIVTDT
jgi:hypothetical protein